MKKKKELIKGLSKRQFKPLIKLKETWEEPKRIYMMEK